MATPLCRTSSRRSSLISLIRRWLKAGILEDGEIHLSEQGTPQPAPLPRPLGPSDGLDLGAALAGSLSDLVVLVLDGGASQVLEGFTEGLVEHRTGTMTAFIR